LATHAERIIHLKDGRVLKEEVVQERRRAEVELARLVEEEP
jgi:hypothetical protein